MCPTLPPQSIPVPGYLPSDDIDKTQLSPKKKLWHMAQSRDSGPDNITPRKPYVNSNLAYSKPVTIPNMPGCHKVLLFIVERGGNEATMIWDPVGKQLAYRGGVGVRRTRRQHF